MESVSGGRTLMLVHGWGESKGVFDRLIGMLPSSLTPIAIDLPGDSGTLAHAADYSVRSLSGHLATVLAELNASASGPNKAVVVGSSSGGYLTQQLSVDYPELLDGLVLVGSPISLAGRPGFANEIERLSDPIDTDWVREFLTWFPLHNPVPATYLDDRIRDGLVVPAQSWRDTLAGLYLATPPLETGVITVPTLVIGGENDDVLGPVHLDLVAAIPGARAKTYENTGHLVLWERPELLAADIASFIDSLGPGTSAIPTSEDQPQGAWTAPIPCDT